MYIKINSKSYIVKFLRITMNWKEVHRVTTRRGRFLGTFRTSLSCSDKTFYGNVQRIIRNAS